MLTRLVPLAAAGILAAAVAHAQDAVTDPQQFVDAAASGNMFEIESSRAAVDRLTDADLAAFAQRMIDDHTAAGDGLVAAAGEEGVTVPAEMNAQHQQQLDALMASEDAAFNDAYRAAQILAHGEAIALFSGYADGGPDGALKTFAAATLPTLQSHADMIPGAMPGGATTEGEAGPTTGAADTTGGSDTEDATDNDETSTPAVGDEPAEGDDTTTNP